jgi:UDP-3-O-[3-hydroxymyristoyl] glucosamine N-acyltransferase
MQSLSSKVLWVAFLFVAPSFVRCTVKKDLNKRQLKKLKKDCNPSGEVDESCLASCLPDFSSEIACGTNVAVFGTATPALTMARIGKVSCIGDEACVGADGKIGDVSCLGKSACLDATDADIGEVSCLGDNSCAGSIRLSAEKDACIGKGLGLGLGVCQSVTQLKVGKKACLGGSACFMAEYSNVRDKSCVGESACKFFNIAAQADFFGGESDIGTESCIGYHSCFASERTHVGDGSCVSPNACTGTKDATIKHGACIGTGACHDAGTNTLYAPIVDVPITIGKGSCINKGTGGLDAACFMIRVSVGDNACNCEGCCRGCTKEVPANECNHPTEDETTVTASDSSGVKVRTCNACLE